MTACDFATPVPFTARNDEVGALARSIGVFQEAMQHVNDLSQEIAEDADAEKLS